MSLVPSTSTSSPNFGIIFAAALKEYKEQTKKDIDSHPLANQLTSCDSPNAVLTVLQTQVQTFDRSESANEMWTKLLDPTVNVLYAFSGFVSNIAGPVNPETLSCFRPALTRSQVFPPAAAIFTGIGVLLQVSVLDDPVWISYFIYVSPRPSRTSALPKIFLSTCLAAWNSFLSGLRRISRSDQLRL
jgi:hypothetical protein